jgi:hypothetical protein
MAGTEELLTQAIGKIFEGSFSFALLKLMTMLGGVVSDLSRIALSFCGDSEHKGKDCYPKKNCK